MVNRAKAKGTLWEVQLRDHFRQTWDTAERLPTEGSKDRGDIGGIPFVVEAKNVRKFSLAEWLDELDKEMTNANKQWGFVAIKRTRKPVGEGYALMPIEQATRLMEIADGAQGR